MIPASLIPSSFSPTPVPREQALDQIVRRLPGRLLLAQSLAPGVAEQYRHLAARLHHVQQRSQVNIVMVSSAMPAEGKTLTATNLALTLSESYRRRVMVIDADLRRPSMHTVFGLPNSHGVNNALTGLAPCPAYEVSPRLAVIPAGPPNPDPVGGLTSPELETLVKAAAAAYEWVIIDTPPVGLLTDANLLLPLVHTVVMVIAANQVGYKQLQHAADVLGRERILGVVLNRAAPSPFSGYDTSYAYAYGGERGR